MVNIDNPDISFLQSRRCWAAIAGPGTGSIVDFLFGEKVARDKPLQNASLPSEVQSYDSEFGLLVQCSWRLSFQGQLVCSSSWSDNRIDGPLLRGLANVVNQKVVSIELNRESCDLKLVFENEYMLWVFNDLPCEDDEEFAFLIRSPALTLYANGFALLDDGST